MNFKLIRGVEANESITPCIQTAIEKIKSVENCRVMIVSNSAVDIQQFVQDGLKYKKLDKTLRCDDKKSFCCFVDGYTDDDFIMRICGLEFDHVVCIDSSETKTLWSLMRCRNPRSNAKEFTYIDTSKNFCGFDKVISNKFKEIDLTIAYKL